MPYQPQPPMDANNTPGLAPRAQLPQNIEAEQSVLAACLLNQPAAGKDRAAGSEKIVGDEHPHTRLDRVLVHL